MAEDELAAARAKHEEEIAEKLAAYEAIRAEQREKEDEEIRMLKEKQAKRVGEREEEEKERREREREEEVRRKAEEEERKQKMLAEQEKRRAKVKKVQRDAFQVQEIIINKKGGSGEDKKAAAAGPTDEELAARKAEFLENNCRAPDLTGQGGEDMKKHITRLYERICRLVGDTYDLEKRLEGQEYDYKELIGRQKQQARQKAIKMGLDPDEAERSKHPPKLKIVTKYDRQIDRRGYGDRKNVYEKKGAIPHYPGVGPPESKLVMKIMEDEEGGEEGEEGGEVEEGEVEEEE